MPSHELKCNLLKQNSFFLWFPIWTHLPIPTHHTHTHTHTHSLSLSLFLSLLIPKQALLQFTILSSPRSSSCSSPCTQSTTNLPPEHNVHSAPSANTPLRFFLSDKMSQVVNLRTKPCPQISFAWPTHYWIIYQHLRFEKHNINTYFWLLIKKKKKSYTDAENCLPL